MLKRTENRKTAKTTGILNKAVNYSLPENPIEFYISEETASYGNNGKKPFTVYYDDPDHSLRLLKGDCIEILNHARENSVDLIFADPPYFLSNGGISCHAGKMVSVNKGKWDKSKGLKENHEFILEWLKACQRVLKPNGTIWVSGTTHIIYSIGFAMQELGYKILNDIIWYKKDGEVKRFRTCFPDSKNIFLWAAKNQKSKYYFDYPFMKQLNGGKQMRNLWEISAEDNAAQTKIANCLKKYKSCFDTKSPVSNIFQRPVELLSRIILSSTKKNDLILDTCCHSSSLGILSSLHKRKYIGVALYNDKHRLSDKQ